LILRQLFSQPSLLPPLKCSGDLPKHLPRKPFWPNLGYLALQPSQLWCRKLSRRRSRMLPCLSPRQQSQQPFQLPARRSSWQPSQRPTTLRRGAVSTTVPDASLLVSSTAVSAAVSAACSKVFLAAISAANNFASRSCLDDGPGCFLACLLDSSLSSRFSCLLEGLLGSHLSGPRSRN